MGLLSSSTKSRGTRAVDIRNPDANEKALLRQQLALAEEQIANFSKLGNFNDQVFLKALPQITQQINKFLGREDTITSESLGFSRTAIGEQKSLLHAAMKQIDQGVKLSADQARLIKSSADNAIAAGTSDIAAFRDDGLRQLAQETSIARGLRPEDTPILDVGGRIVRDADRQASELINTVRSQEAQQRLQYPIQAGQYRAALIGQQQQLGTTNQAFINQLRQDAFNNRLNLLSTAGNIGVNSSQIGPNPSTLDGLQKLRLGTASVYTTGKGSGGGIGDLLGGAGGFFEGLGAIGVGV